MREGFQEVFVENKNIFVTCFQSNKGNTIQGIKTAYNAQGTTTSSHKGVSNTFG